MADALIKFETIDSDQIGDIMEGREVREPKDWQAPPPSDKDNDDSESAKPEESKTESVAPGPASGETQ